MWRAPKVDPAQAVRMRELRAKLDVGPLVIHTSYLVNVCSQSNEVRLEQPAYFRGPEKRLWELTLAEASAVIYRNEIATPAEMNGMLDELRALADDDSVLIAQWLSPGIIARK